MAGLLTSAQVTWMTNLVVSSLDASVVVKRNSSTPSNDGYGHTTESLTTIGTFNVNVIKPNAAQLQVLAGIIGSPQVLMIRFNPANDIRENDIIVYNSINWRVQNIQKAESYTFAPEAVISAIL